ncbi:hypothetical protein BMMGA3_17045 (plasmid) [Bacillus methanolicus MGA3]|uniref:Uncharacterized protein n=1 Tax=Bacillus methanolicus (strain MGA3 / ATCC 53907) TaxID=796606 RepID=A0A068LVH1_BACMM|nr:hypothetical protein BMMGA3_17045 [Bacillus methanolicus MGA3]
MGNILAIGLIFFNPLSQKVHVFNDSIRKAKGKPFASFNKREVKHQTQRSLLYSMTPSSVRMTFVFTSTVRF